MSRLPRIAVIADPHYHPIDRRPGGGDGGAIRTLADTCESTRVFNESFPALHALLDDIVARGIEIVVVAGDLTDDGQASTTRAATGLLLRYSEKHGLRFFATPGNHDLYAIHGRHQGKRFLNADGSHSMVTSDAGEAQGDSRDLLLTQEMYCGGYDSALKAMAPFGFVRGAGMLHWETPFDGDDDLGTRRFDIQSADGGTERTIADASYLVEPVEGLWLLAIDANVFEPKNGDLDPRAEKSWIDSTDAGWNSMLRNKPFVFDWMKDVAARAKTQGKRLLAFSHYPIIDPLNGTAAEEARLLGNTGFVRRTPGPEVAAAAAATGVNIHFGGHLHINDTAVARAGDDFIVNIAVPSMVGFPPGYKIASFEGDTLRVETVLLDRVEGFDAAFEAYRAETARTGENFGDLLEAGSHGEFLSRHLAQMVRCRYLPREWPQDLAALVPLLDVEALRRLADMAPVTADQTASAFAGRAPQGLTFMDIVVDWYRLRKGRELAFDFIAPERVATYRGLCRLFASGQWADGSLQARLAGFFAIMQAYLDSQVSRDFAVDLIRGELSDLALARTDLRQTGTA